MQLWNLFWSMYRVVQALPIQLRNCFNEFFSLSLSLRIHQFSQFYMGYSNKKKVWHWWNWNWWLLIITITITVSTRSVLPNMTSPGIHGWFNSRLYTHCNAPFCSSENNSPSAIYLWFFHGFCQSADHQSPPLPIPCFGTWRFVQPGGWQ